jgi:hypothetical protein
VELPDGTARVIPLAWTDRATSNFEHFYRFEDLHLSPFGLLEALELIKKLENCD